MAAVSSGDAQGRSRHQHEMYIVLMCAFAPSEVYAYLVAHDYRLEHCLPAAGEGRGGAPHRRLGLSRVHVCIKNALP